MRLFAAVALDGTEKDLIIKFSESLRSTGLDGHFTDRDNLHITLKFLGEVQPVKINGIKAALD